MGKKKKEMDTIFDNIESSVASLIRKNYILESAVNNGLNYVYVVDVKTNTIIYANHVLVDLYGKELKGSLCHESINGWFHVCNLCSDANKLDDPLTWTFWSERFNKMFFVTRVFKNFDGRIYRIEKATDITSAIDYIKTNKTCQKKEN